MATGATVPGSIRRGVFTDPQEEKRYLAARRGALARTSRAALWLLAVPNVLAPLLDWTLLSGTTWMVVSCARVMLVASLVGGGFLCARLASAARLALAFTASVGLALVAYGTIAVCYQTNVGRTDALIVFGAGGALTLVVHPGRPSRASQLAAVVLAAAAGTFFSVTLPWTTVAWNLITICASLTFGTAAHYVLNTHWRATYAMSERLARSEAELRRMREAEARAAQRALARREDAWQALVDSAPVLVLIVDVSGCVTFVNKAAAEVGFRPGDPLGAVLALLPEAGEDGAVPDAPRLHALLSSDAPAQFDARIRAGDGWHRYHGHLAPIGSARPHVEVIVVAADVTQSHELSEALHAAQKQQTMGVLAAGVAHDVNNLLAVILASAELSAMGHGLDERTRANLDSIQSAVARASRLTRQLLMFASRRPGLLESVDANVVLGDLDVLFRRLLGTDVQIAYELDPELPLLQIDQSHFEQVMLNLVTNARDAMGAGGTLHIITKSANGGGEVVMRDSGCGMSEEVRARMFEPFFTTKGARGTGIGLATVARAMARFGGKLIVQSTERVGTEVTLWLKAAASEALPPSVRAEPVGSGCKVLVVDDEPEVLRLAAAMLSQHGYQTAEARSFEEARASLATLEPEVLVTDVRMPGMRGRELAVALRALRPNLAVIFMSGCVDDPVLLEEIEAGDELLLDKPFTSRDLASMVERARKRQSAARFKPSA